MDDLMSLTNSLKEDIAFQNDLSRRSSEPAAAPESAPDDDDEEPSWLTEASDAVASTVKVNDEDDDEPDWLTSAAEDAFTPQLLDTLGHLPGGPHNDWFPPPHTYSRHQTAFEASIIGGRGT